jgi:hypothetical protein
MTVQRPAASSQRMEDSRLRGGDMGMGRWGDTPRGGVEDSRGSAPLRVAAKFSANRGKLESPAGFFSGLLDRTRPEGYHSGSSRIPDL